MKKCEKCGVNVKNSKMLFETGLCNKCRKNEKKEHLGDHRRGFAWDEVDILI
jgi:hypothetical protein